ncbi:MAG: TraX family protein [Eubacteriales bacterium]
MNYKLPRPLTGNMLKAIAAAAMLCDHTAVILLPNSPFYTAMRAVGRLAFPIFAFFIAEGCAYTSSRVKYLLTMLAVGIPCQLLEFFAAGEKKLNIMFTLALGAELIFAYDRMISGGAHTVGTNGSENNVSEPKSDVNMRKFLGIGMFCAVILLCASAAVFPGYQYSFFGALLPLSAHIMRGKCYRLAPFMLTLAAISLFFAKIQLYSLAALLPLALYGGERGKYKMKLFFYIFYPAHLAVLWGLHYCHFH